MDEVYLRTEDMAKWVVEKYFENRDFITLDEFYRAFEELSADYDMLKEEYEDFKKDVNDNYKFMPIEEQIDYSERW